MEKKETNIFKELIPYIIIVIIVVLFRSFIMTPVEVEGQSMYSTLKNGEILILKKYDKNYKRFDVIVFKNEKDKLIKRVIGLPGESVEYKDNKLYINGKYVKEKFLKNDQQTYDFSLEELGYKKIPKNYYFVLGDNRTNSTDSRIIGLINSKQITGKSDFIIFPFTKIGKF
ncbi:MAG: signal peptidase I [Bacilli bacterium]|nr:signal peptidase I [Bacilli bacterium]